MNATATIAPAEERVEEPFDSQRPDPPSGPDQQYMRALQRANEVRMARAELKRQVARGKADVAEIVLCCPWEADSMAVGDLLMSQRRWGQTRARKLLAQVPMSERKTIGSMTDRQRRTLAALLRGQGAPQRAIAEGPERQTAPARSALVIA